MSAVTRIGPWGLIGALCLVACAPADRTTPADTAEATATDTADAAGPDRAAVAALVEDFDAAVNAADVDALMATFAENPVSMPPNQPAVAGREAVRAFWSGFLEQGEVTADNVLVDFHADADLLVARGTYSLSIAPAEGEPMQDAGKWVAWFQRGDDGAWKSLGNAWSSNSLPPDGNGR